MALDAGDLALRQLTEVWLDELLDMTNDPAVARLCGTRPGVTDQELLSEITARKADPTCCDWAILHSTTGEFVGNIVLHEFDEPKNAMTMRVSLAGERWMDRGIGTAVLETVLTHAFDGMQLSRVNVSVPVANARALRVFTRLGFSEGRQYDSRGVRHQRLSLSKLQFVLAIAERLMGESLDTQKWSFAFDSGKRRAGLCDHTNRRISLSKHMSGLHSVDQSRQVMYHEIAHALAGAKHGHDKQWLRIATDLGYRNERISGRAVDEAHARWRGICPNGHEYFRYRRPTRVSSCSKCSRKYDDRYKILWDERTE